MCRAQASQASQDSLLFTDKLQANVIGLVVYTTVFAHAAKHGSLALAVVVHRQPIAEHRLIHVKALGVPYVRLEPHFRLTSGGQCGALTSRVLAEEICRSASMLATRPLVELGRWLDERCLADAVRQTLAQITHRTASHVTWQELKERRLTALVRKASLRSKSISFFLYEANFMMLISVFFRSESLNKQINKLLH